MKYFLIVAFLFITGSLIGYQLELFYRRIKHKKWINPGFLVGPYLPLYGFGVISLYAISRICDLISFPNIIIKYIITLLIMALIMTAIEYITGLIFIKGMKIKLWDYSSRWGNIQGIICPLFSLFWTIAAAIYLFLIDPILLKEVDWLMENLEFSFGIGVIGGIMLVDAFYSFNIASKITKFAKDNNLQIRYENLKMHIKERNILNKVKPSFLLAFKSNKETLKQLLESYLKRIKNRNKEKEIK